jgi:uncharacterized protein YndB with AHSA1/START domain
MAMKRDLHFENVYPHPLEQVWAALTDSAALSQWLMPNDFEPRVGHRFRFRTKPAPGFDGIVDCEVLEVEPPHRLVYSWKGGGVDTLLTWTLRADPRGTHLRLDHTGFRGFHGLFVSMILGKGWGSRILFRSLPALLDRWESLVRNTATDRKLGF